MQGSDTIYWTIIEDQRKRLVAQPGRPAQNSHIWIIEQELPEQAALLPAHPVLLTCAAWHGFPCLQAALSPDKQVAGV